MGKMRFWNDFPQFFFIYSHSHVKSETFLRLTFFVVLVQIFWAHFNNSVIERVRVSGKEIAGKIWLKSHAAAVGKKNEWTNVNKQSAHMFVSTDNFVLFFSVFFLLCNVDKYFYRETSNVGNEDFFKSNTEVIKKNFLSPNGNSALRTKNNK